MTIEFRCPFCQKVLKTPDDRAGVKANCPGCGESVTVPSTDHRAAGELAPSADVQDPVATVSGALEPDGAAPDELSLASAATRPCPMCGAEIQQAAKRCRFCGEDLIDRGDVLGPGRIEAGDILTRSWEIFQKNIGILVSSTLVLMGIALVSVLVGYAGMIAVVVGIGAAGQGGQGPDAVAIAAFIAVLALFTIFLFAMNSILQGGYHILMFRIARGEKAEVGDLFSGRRFFWRLFWGNVLFTLLFYVGLALCVIPAIPVMLAFWPFSFVIVDQDVGVVESFRKSRELMTGNWLAVFIIGLAAMGINMLGQMACYVGMIFTIPLGALIFAVAYCRMCGQATAGGRQG